MSMLHKNSGLLEISGPDAARFLQGQLTVDIATVTDQACRLSTHCNREGRMISLFNLFLHQDNYYLLMPDGMVLLTLSALKKYAVFFKASLEKNTGEDITIPPIPYPNLPMIYPETSGKFLPHEFNLHETHAISFDKGCYTGQEIIARMHYRGKPKKYLYRGLIEGSQPLLPGTPLYYGEDQSALPGGTVLGSIHDEPSFWLHCHEAHAKDNHLFLEHNRNAYVTFLNG